MSEKIVNMFLEALTEASWSISADDVKVLAKTLLSERAERAKNPGELVKCTTCGAEKPQELFSKSKKHSSGFRGECKECEREYKNRKKGEFYILSPTEISRHILYDKTTGDFFKTDLTPYPESVHRQGCQTTCRDYSGCYLYRPDRVSG